MAYKPLGKCKNCGLTIQGDKYANVPYCSKRCSLEADELEHLQNLAKTKENLKWESKSNYIWKKFDKIIVIGDTHFPFVHPAKYEKALEFIKAEKLTDKSFIVQVGDLYDRFSQSRFARTHSLYTPQQEVKLGTEMARKFWEIIDRAHPKATKIQIKGNHDIRPYKILLERCPELEPFFVDNPLFEFENVTTVHEHDQEVLIDDIVFQHGYTKHGNHMRANLMKTVVGHTHKGGVEFMNLRGHIIWELNAGYLGDPESTALKYRERRWHNWTHGIAIIDKYGPRFIHL